MVVPCSDFAMSKFNAIVWISNSVIVQNVINWKIDPKAASGNEKVMQYTTILLGEGKGLIINL